MNKYPYKITNEHDPYFGKTPPVDYRTGWSMSDSVIASRCPKCGSGPGFYCETPKGRKAWPPHNERPYP